MAECSRKSVVLFCSYGEPWVGKHPLCKAEVDRACRAFTEAVQRGEYDEEGYTPAERKAADKRLQAAGRLF